MIYTFLAIHNRIKLFTVLQKITKKMIIKKMKQRDGVGVSKIMKISTVMMQIKNNLFYIMALNTIKLFFH